MAKLNDQSTFLRWNAVMEESDIPLQFQARKQENAKKQSNKPARYLENDSMDELKASIETKFAKVLKEKDQEI